MKSRFGASTLAAVLSLMGVTALGAAGYNAVTGDLCAMVGSCSTGCDGEKTACATSCDEKAAKVVEASAKEGEGKACCALGSLAKEASAKSECSSKSECTEGGAKTINAAATSECSSKSECSKSCDGEAKTINAAAKSECSKSCDGAAKTINAAAKSECSKSCDGAAKTIAASADNSGCCKSGSKTVNASANGDCSKSCDGGAAKTIAVAGSEGGTCASTCSGENTACTWKQTAESIDANLIAAKAAYEGACEGQCEQTKGMAKAKLMAAEWRSAERDLHRAKSKLAQLKVAKAEMAYEGACEGKCDATKASMKAAVLQANIYAEETYVAYSNFMECRKCIDGHSAKLKDAKVMQASFEYDAACEKGCESSKAAAKAKIESIKAGKDCASECTEKSAAACTTSCKGEKVATKAGDIDEAAAIMAVSTSAEGETCANTCSSSKSCSSKDKSAL